MRTGAALARRGGFAALTAACLVAAFPMLVPVLADAFRRTGMYGILVLAMLPLSCSRRGLALGLPLGIVSGIFGTLAALEAGFSGLAASAASVAFSTPVSLGLGWAHGRLLERKKGNETAVSLAAGLVVTAFAGLPFLLLPFSRPGLSWGSPGSGLRSVIRLADFGGTALAGRLAVDLGGSVFDFGLLLPFALTAAVLAFAFRRWPGRFAGSVSSAALSAWLGGLGIVAFQQASGTVLPYLGPLSPVLPAAGCLVAGGAADEDAGVGRAVYGTALFQTLAAACTALAGGDPRIEQVLGSGLVLIFLLRRKGGRP